MGIEKHTAPIRYRHSKIRESMNPKEIKIESKTWWVKPIEMLVQNWALIEENSKNKFTAYFFHDRGTTKGGG